MSRPEKRPLAVTFSAVDYTYGSKRGAVGSADSAGGASAAGVAGAANAAEAAGAANAANASGASVVGSANAANSCAPGASVHEPKNNGFALRGLNLAVEQGEFVALVGANGSGKSTAAQLINALLVPTAGRVLTLGLDTASLDDEVIFEIRSQAGLVLQNPDSQIVASIVADDVAFGPENLAVPHADIVQRVDEALDAVKMGDYALAHPVHLSGGQKQRVCIAGLLAMKPRVLILDEPGAMLDVRGRRGVRRVLGQLHSAGLTVLLVTHFMEEAALAERIVVLAAGAVALEGTPREVFSQGEELRRLGLDVPFSVQLATALQARGLTVPPLASPRELREFFAQGVASDAAGEPLPCHAAPCYPSHEGSPPSNCAGLTVLRCKTAPTATKPCKIDGSAAQIKPSEQNYTAEPSILHTQPTQPTSPGYAACNAAVESPPALSLVELTHSYGTHNTREDTPALSGVSLEVPCGALLGVVGHTGSGKTTLLRAIAGLLKPSAGSVHVAGVNLTAARKKPALHGTVGMVFQYPERQLFARTVADDIAFGPRNARLAAGEVDKRVRRAMERLGLSYDRYAQRSPFELSGGEKRRVAIAGVVAMEPEVLIFDEPTAGLDIHAQRRVQELIMQLRACGITIVLTSHSLDTIAELADLVAVLDGGRLAMLGTPVEVFCSTHAAALKQMNLGLPQAAEFALELAKLGLELPEGLFTVEALANALVDALAQVPASAPVTASPVPLPTPSSTPPAILASAPAANPSTPSTPPATAPAPGQTKTPGVPALKSLPGAECSIPPQGGEPHGA